MIKLVLWDIDGTLTDFKKAEEIGIKKCFEQFNLGECSNEMLKDYSEINDRYWKMLEKKEITKPELLVKRFDEFFKKYKIKCNSKKFNIAYQEELRQEVCLQPGAKKTVSELKKLNIPQYVVTNGLVESQNKKLKNVRLHSYFENVFISDEIGHDKPTVEFFKPVLKEINEKYPDIKKEEILIVGDSLSSDIQGGINIGIKTCWFNPKHAISEMHRDYEVDKLVKVLDLFKEEEKEEVVEKIELKTNTVSIKDIIDNNYRVIILGLAAIALLFICLFIGTNKSGNKTYTLDELFKTEGYSQTMKIPNDWYISDGSELFVLEEEKLSPVMQGFIQETYPEEVEASFEVMRQEYDTEDLICGDKQVLLIKNLGDENYSYEFAYVLISDHEVLCLGFINVDQKQELKVLNSIK